MSVNSALTAQTIASGAAARLGLKPKAQASIRNPIAFTDFKRRMYKHYIHEAHLEALDSHLTQVAEYIRTGGKSGIGRLIVEMPPRHGKSLTTAIYFPAWLLGNLPDSRIISVSYAASLAQKHSRKTRALLNSPRYQELFPGIQLAKDSRAVSEWNLDRYEGGLDAIGVLGSATGKGAHLLLCDDLLKNRQAAESEQLRERTWDAFTDDLYTRLEPGGAIVLMGTRWHTDDVHGRAISRMAHEDWVHIRFPAYAEENDPLGRPAGAALSVRYPIERLQKIELTEGPYAWASEYQQRPTPAEGGIIKRDYFDIVDRTPEVVRAWRFCDLAMSAKTSADETATVKMALCADGHYYVVDVTHDRVDWGQLAGYLADIMLGDGSQVIQGLEQAGYMSRAVQDLNSDYRMAQYSIWGYTPDKDKLTRLLPVAAKLASHNIHLVRAHWNDAFMETLMSFPHGTHDDMVDALSGVWIMASEDYSGELPSQLSYSQAGAIPGEF